MRTLGIEFGSWSLKAVEVETRFRRMEILDFHEIRLPLEITDPQASFREAVTKLMSRLPHHPEKLVTSLPMSQTALRFFHLPVKQAKKAEQMYRFELEDNVPFKLDNAIVEHHISRTGDGSFIAAGIAPKAHVQGHLDWLAGVGVDPDWLTFDGMGLVNVYLRRRDESQKGKKRKKAESDDLSGCTLLMDIGHLKTGIAILEGDRLEYYRSIPWGGAHISHAISSALNISLEEAETKKHRDLSIDVPPDSLSGDLATMVQAAQHAFLPLFTDVQHTLVAFRAQAKKDPGSVLLSGGTSSLQGIASFLSRRFKRPVDHFDPLSSHGDAHDLPVGTTLRFGEAFGRATVYERKAALLFNFRKQELAKKTSLTEVTTVLKDPHAVRLLKYTGALAAILFLHVTIASHFAASEAASSRQELSKVFSQTFRNVPNKLRSSLTQDPEALRKYIRQRNKELEQRMNMLSTRRTPVLELMDSISNAFPKDIRVDVNVLSLNDRSMQIEGVLYEGDLAAVTQNLQAVPSFKNVQLSREGQRFTFRGNIEGR